MVDQPDHEGLPASQPDDDTAGEAVPTPLPGRRWPGLDHYDRAGHPIDAERWGELLSTEGYKRVAATELPDGTLVSTVWLGLDHRFSGDGPPLIFETMVFRRADNWADDECHRYPTEAAALAGHDQVVAKIREALDRLAAAMADIDAGKVDLTKKPRPC